MFTCQFDNNGVAINVSPYDGSIDLSMFDVNGVSQLAMETANCYVIKQPGTYKLPLVYGNAIKNGTTNSAAYTQVAPESGNTQPFYNYKNVQITSPYIETDTNTQAASGVVLYSDVSGYNLSDIQIVDGSPCRYVQFKVDSVPALGGNLMLAVKDSGGQVMWSWHIWAYPSTIGYKSHTNTTGYTYDWMDVDLGWIKDNADSIYGESPYYQWGRKDPMLRYNNSSNTPAIGSWSITSCATSLAATIQNPNVFNTYESSRCNWWTDNGTVVNFFNYWDASTSTTGNRDNIVVKTIYDPCPRGWHVPNGNCFTGCSVDTGGTWNQGYTWDGRYFRASGYRHFEDGSAYSFIDDGYRWLSSSYSTDNAFSFSFYSSSVYPLDFNSRSDGFPVCPVKY